MLITRPGDF